MAKGASLAQSDTGNGDTGNCDTIWRDCRMVTMTDGACDVVAQALVAAKDGRIVYVGPEAGAPPLSADETVICHGRLVTPGLVDCHTHLVYAGNRAAEHEARRTGTSYEEIARAGGGINATVTATRAASEDQLVAESLPRLDAMIARGMTTVEVKSGYGLDVESELKMLRAARRLAELRPINLRTTFLGAHTVPSEYRGRADDYIRHICEDMLPAVAQAGLADSVDGFCETIGFTPAQIARVMEAAVALGLPVKLHAEQLSDSGGAALAASYGALSADHLEYLDAQGIAAMAGASTVAVLLPGAFYFMRETQKPPIAELRAAGVAMALATDCNPGTSPLTSLPLAMNMAWVLFGLTVPECLAGTTINAAKALAMDAEIGSLEPGKQCDLAIWDVDDPALLVQQMGLNPLYRRIWNGKTG